jgi:hypothetical protein
VFEGVVSAGVTLIGDASFAVSQMLSQGQQRCPVPKRDKTCKGFPTI